MRRTISFIVLVAAAMVAVRIVKARAPITRTPPENATQRWSPPDITAAYDAECKPGARTPACAALRGAVLYELVWGLEGISTTLPETGDAQLALDALDVWEPEVKEAALRVLHRQALPAGADAKLLAVVLGDRWSLQRSAADLLVSSSSPSLQRVGRQWIDNHVNQIGVVARPDVPELLWASAPRPRPAAVGFVEYPGATAYSPGESDRAIAFVTSDSIDKVVSFYAKGRSAPLDASKWQAWLQAHQPVYYPQPDPKEVEKAQKAMMDKSARIGALAERWAKSQDPKLQKQMEALQAEIEADSKALEAKLPKYEDRPGVLPVVVVPPGDLPAKTAKIFVEENAKKRATRVLSIYREDAVNGTVIEMVWDPTLVTPKP